MRALYLAADGGNSKTDMVLGDDTGQILGFVRGGTSSPHNVGLAGAVEVLGALVRAVHANAGLPLGTPIDAVAVYLAVAMSAITIALEAFVLQGLIEQPIGRYPLLLRRAS